MGVVLTMRALEERRNTRNEREHGEANYVGTKSGGGGGCGYGPRSVGGFAPREPGAGG